MIYSFLNRKEFFKNIKIGDILIYKTFFDHKESIVGLIFKISNNKSISVFSFMGNKIKRFIINREIENYKILR